MGFFIGAGLGEEFWKMGFGTLLVLFLVITKRKINKADCILGFVSLGLAFGAAENLIAYRDLESHLLLSRGLIAVPLHAGMGMIHGLAVHKARVHWSATPLFFGYFGTALFHTLCDAWSILLPNIGPHTLVLLWPTILVIWGIWKWKNVPEFDEPLGGATVAYQAKLI